MTDKIQAGYAGANNKLSNTHTGLGIGKEGNLKKTSLNFDYGHIALQMLNFSACFFYFKLYLNRYKYWQIFI
ncbi:MAG TPA: hypothetical protein PKC69_02695 [Chitinophagaceae bacterium]|nr:hypothetical protein [Chitinophagaceae bacterium]